MPILLALVGCDRPIQACPAIAQSSVQIDLTDADGAPIPAANVQFSVDGGATQDCESWDDGTYVCGWEQVGEFVISIEADGYEPIEVEATVDGYDGCDLDSQLLDVQLDEVACTQELVPAVVGTLSHADSDVQVFWEYVDHDSPAHPCDFFDIEFQCADEISGDLRVFAHDDIGGYAEAVVSVEHDGCHPITEEVELELEWGDPEPNEG